MDKKGLSPVVATILLVMLTVTAVGIIAGYLLPFVKNSLDSTTCTKYKDYFSFYESGYNCYDGQYQGFSIEAKSDKELGKNIVGFNIVLSKEGSSDSSEARSNADCGTLRMFNKTVCKIEIPSSGEVRSYVFDKGSETFSRLRVTPVISINGKEMTCEPSDEMQVGACGDGVSF